MFTKSIRWRLLSWLGFLLAIILACFGITAYQLNRSSRLAQIDEELSRRVTAISTDVRHPQGPSQGPGFKNDSPPPHQNFPGHGPPDKGGPDFDFDDGPRGPPGPGNNRNRPGPPEGPDRFRGLRNVQLSLRALSLFDDPEGGDFYYVIWSSNGRMLKQSTNAPIHPALPGRPNSDTSIHTLTRGTYQEAFHFTELGDCILVGRSIAEDLSHLRSFGWWLAVVGVSVLTLGVGVAWLLANRALRPVRDISVTAERISAGKLFERIAVAETDDELGRLAGVLNSTFARLDAAFTQQKQFTADASHELRTPLAALIVEAQTTLARERSAAEYRQSLEACLDTAQQMRRLAESLLALARLDANREELPREKVEMDEMARTVVALINPLATERGIKIICELTPVIAWANASHLNQVFTNLLTNAIQYNKPGGEVRLSTRAENDRAVLMVADTGEGIAQEDLPHIFERFFRADKSRSSAQGHSGLGLAICKAIVDAHGGTIEVSSARDVGTAFTIKLPASKPE